MEGTSLASTLLDLLPLPDYPRIVFERPPLVLTICQVKFSRVLSVVDTKYIAPFQRAIQRQYPIAKPAQEVSFEAGFGPDGAEFRQSAPSVRWQFSDPAQNWTVVLSEEFCAIESCAYDHFDDFLGRLRPVLDALSVHITPETIGTRIGLRYINEVRLDSIDERRAVQPHLLGLLGVDALTQYAETVVGLQQVALRYEGNHGININHGRIANGSTIKPRPNEAAKRGPFYLLDFDVFREFPLPDGLPMERDVICEHVDTFHRAIDRLFRWAVTEEYVSTLGVRGHAGDQ